MPQLPQVTCKDQLGGFVHFLLPIMHLCIHRTTPRKLLSDVLRPVLQLHHTATAFHDFWIENNIPLTFL